MLPPVVQFLLISNILIYMLEMSTGSRLIEAFALWPLNTSPVPGFRFAHAHFQLYQLVTYAFLHGSVMHLLLNMYALWLFGTRMENVWGSRVFTIYYFVCVLGAGIVQLLVATLSGGLYPTIGASGGIFGLLLAFGMSFPNERLLLIIPPVPIKAKWFVTIYAVIELWAGVTGTEAGVAHFAHLGGMLFGYILIVYWRKHPPTFG
jgi:membrane associated rhomboid family serine protease